MAGQILVPLKKHDLIKEILPYIEKIIQPGMRVVFLVPYQIWGYWGDGFEWLEAYWKEIASRIHPPSQARKIMENYSLEHQREAAEQKIFPACETLQKNGVELAVDIYRGPLKMAMKGYTCHGALSLSRMRACVIGSTVRFLRKMMRDKRAALMAFALMLSWVVLATASWAEPLKIAMTLSNPQHLQINFPLVGAEKHYINSLKREGVVDQGSTWAGAKVQEIGVHDVYPGEGTRGMGYITFTLPDGDRVSMKYDFVASFLPSPEGKMMPAVHGFWTIIGGNGKLAAIRGAGNLRFKGTPADSQARVWGLTGEIALVKK